MKRFDAEARKAALTWHPGPPQWLTSLLAEYDAQAATLERVRALAHNQALTPHQRWEAICAALGPAPAQAVPSQAELQEYYDSPLPAPAQAENPVPMQLDCPKCGLHHVDTLDQKTGIDWATRLHKTHLCLGCGHLFKPAEFATVGMPAPVQAEPFKFGDYASVKRLWLEVTDKLEAAEARCAELLKRAESAERSLSTERRCTDINVAEKHRAEARCAELEKRIAALVNECTCD